MDKFKIFQRMIKIYFFIFIGYFRGYLRYLDIDYKTESSLTKDDVNKLFSDITIEIIENMGPTFIKFGQVLSSRPDLLPPFFIESLKKLQDDVAPFSYNNVENTFLSEFNKKPSEIFKEFNEKPIASASVAQVHKAKLNSGEIVAVKIQRPDIKKNMHFDLTMLKIFSKFTEKISSKARLINLVNIIEELEKALINQLDFNLELENLERFIENFKNDRDISFPKPFKDYSSKKILVMEFIDGIKPTDYEKINADPEKIAELGLDASLKMIYRDGFFHADPHPGNVFIIKETKKLGIIDCGVVGKISKEEKKITLNFILGVVQNDPVRVADSIFQACGGVEKYPSINYNDYLEDITVLFNEYVSNLKLSEIEFSIIISKIYAIIARHKIRIVANYTMIFVALITIEGLAKSLVPDFDLIEKTRFYMFDIMNALDMV
jgi:ubiquinone biosynthesis protein